MTDDVAIAVRTPGPDPELVAMFETAFTASDGAEEGALVTRGLDELRRRGVLAAFTYGDPRYYARFGFGPAEPALGPAPFPLGHPEGWLGRWLSDAPTVSFTGRPRCVEALQHPRYW